VAGGRFSFCWAVGFHAGGLFGLSMEGEVAGFHFTECWGFVCRVVGSLVWRGRWQVSSDHHLAGVASVVGWLGVSWGWLGVFF